MRGTPGLVVGHWLRSWFFKLLLLLIFLKLIIEIRLYLIGRVFLGRPKIVAANIRNKISLQPMRSRVME